MRQHPIGTGPFKFVEFKPNEDIKVVRNPDYWKPGRPYLDGIDYTSCEPLDGDPRLYRRQFDMTWPYSVDVPLMKDVEDPGAERRSASRAPTTAPPTCCINRDKPPFDNPDLRRAMAL